MAKQVNLLTLSLTTWFSPWNLHGWEEKPTSAVILWPPQAYIHKHRINTFYEQNIHSVALCLSSGLAFTVNVRELFSFLVYRTAGSSDNRNKTRALSVLAFSDLKCALFLPSLTLLFFSVFPYYHHATLSTFSFLKIKKSFLNLTLPTQILSNESSASVLSLCCPAHKSEFQPHCSTRTQREAILCLFCQVW